MNHSSGRGSTGNQGRGAQGAVRLVVLAVIILVSLYNLYSGGDDTKPETTKAVESQDLSFRNQSLLESHYEKHGMEMGFSSAVEYEEAASAVALNPKSLHRYEQEDGDSVYFLESTGEFVIVSRDGYIRTYYYADKAYFERQ